MMTTGDILIVDDERDIRSLIGAVLRDEGYPTVEAATAGEARDILAAKPLASPFSISGCVTPTWTASSFLSGSRVSIPSFLS